LLIIPESKGSDNTKYVKFIRLSKNIFENHLEIYDLQLTLYEFRSIIVNVKRSYEAQIKRRKTKMSNPNMEAKIKELMELKRMKEEIEAEIAAAEDEIKSVMGEEETLLAGAFKVDWKTVITSRIDTTALKKALPEIAERFMKQTTTRRFCVR